MKFKIKNREIGEGNSVFIVAELSANHNQNYELALKTIKAAKEAGADAIKLQTYTSDTMTINSNKEFFQIKQGTIWDGQTLYDLYKKAYTPWEWQPKLKEFAEKLGLICFSSAFDKTSVDFLEKMNVPAYKIASFEITDLPLIKYVASKGKPIILSTGIATKQEIKEAVEICRKENNNQIAVLKCTSAYPAPLKEMNLKTIPDLAKTFKIIPGLSDHTLGISASIAAVTLGAKIIEKHFILDRNLSGPDSSFSLEPKEFKQMTDSIREVEKSLGKINYELTEKAKMNRDFSRSLFGIKDIKAGETLNEQNIKSIRPGFGLAPKYYEEIIGKKAKKDIERGTPISWELIEN